MADVTILIKSGNAIKNGNAVLLVSPVRGVYTTLSPQVLENGCIHPSGTFGQTDDGPLDNRFVKGTYGYTG